MSVFSKILRGINQPLDWKVSLILKHDDLLVEQIHKIIGSHCGQNEKDTCQNMFKAAEAIQVLDANGKPNKHGERAIGFKWNREGNDLNLER